MEYLNQYLEENISPNRLKIHLEPSIQVDELKMVVTAIKTCYKSQS